MTFSVFRFDFLEFGIWVFFILSDGLTIFSNSIIFLISIFFWNNWRRGGRFCKNTLWIGGFVFWFLFMIFVFQLKLVKNELQTVGFFSLSKFGYCTHVIKVHIFFKKVTNIWRNLPFNCQIFVAFTEYMNTRGLLFFQPTFWWLVLQAISSLRNLTLCLNHQC